MSEERQRVLQMLKAGKITVEEAEALLEALEEEQQAVPSETAAGTPAGTTVAAGARSAQAPAGTEPSEGQPGDRRGEFHRLIDDIVASVGVDSIMETVRESLKRSKVDMQRIKDEVRRATHRAREESRRAAREYRRYSRHGFGHHGFGMSISRAIEGLWGLSDASGSWTHEADLAAGRSLAIRNTWGDIRLEPSADGRLHLDAVTRAWGRDQAEARRNLDQLRITARDEDTGFTVRVEPPAGDLPRRVRVDLKAQVPTGVAVDAALARGDVDARGLGGDLAISVISGDVSIRDHQGSVRIESAKSDAALERVAGDVQVSTKHGDVTLTDIGGRADVSVLHGDISVSRVKGDVDLRTLSGDVDAGVEAFSPGTTSVMSTMSGDVAVRLGERAHCRITARVTSGEIKVSAPIADVQQNRRWLQGVIGSPDAALELSTVSGDVSISAQPVDVPARG